MNTRYLLATGYVALDVIRHEGSVRQSAGGTATNVAANLAHLGWRSQLVGRIGDDAQARRILADLRAADVDTKLLVRDPSIETPVVVHEVLQSRHRFDFRCPQCGRGSPRYRPQSVEFVEEVLAKGATVSGQDVVFVDRASTFSVEMLARAAGRGALTVFEPSSRGTEAASRAAAGHAAILRWSAETRPRLHSSTLVARAGQLQIESVADRGLRWRLGVGGWRSLRPPTTEPIDGAGAGDWLTTGFLDALPDLDLNSLVEQDIVAALEIGQAFAALSCRYVGARTLAGVPSAEIRAAVMRIREGGNPAAPRPRDRRRSRARNVCQVCLGPA